MIAENDQVLSPKWSTNLARYFKNTKTIRYSEDHYTSIGGPTSLFIIDNFPDKISDQLLDWIKGNYSF